MARAGWMSLGGVIAKVGMIVLMAAAVDAQELRSFEQLPLWVNLNDRVHIEDQSGAAFSGRLTSLSEDGITVETADGARRFAPCAVRSIAVREDRFGRAALIGAGAFAALGVAAVCARRGGNDCAVVGALGAMPIGAGAGLAVAGLFPGMKHVYRAPADCVSTQSPSARVTAKRSLLQELGSSVNLEDRLEIAGESATPAAGRLTHLADDEITIETAGGAKRFPRDEIRKVAVRRHPFRPATLIGAAAGAIAGALSECRAADHSECADGVLILASLGAAAGFAAGGLLNQTTTVYPESQTRAVIVPSFAGRGIAVSVSRRW